MAVSVLAVLVQMAAGLPLTAAPAIRTNTLLAGTRFATEAYVHDSGKRGPTVFLCAGAHGNEPAGALAAENIRHWPITRGRLVVVPRANVTALQVNRRYTPGLDTNLHNLNRNYPRVALRERARGTLAQAIWELVSKSKPHWVLDLHEGFDFHQLNARSVGSSIIAFPSADGLRAADAMLAAVNAYIADPKLKFVRRDQPVDGSLARAAGEHLQVPGMTLETTTRLPLLQRVRQHEVMVHRLLADLGMVGDLPLAPAIAATPHDHPVARLRVALYQGPGTGGAGPPNLLKKLNQPPTLAVAPVTPEEIQNGVLTNYHVVLFAGGSGSRQAAALGESGRAKVRQFVSNGGGYIGICAGAYLATSGYSWSLNLINARTVSPKWQRGAGLVKMQLTETGSSILGRREGEFDVRYVNGPIVTADDEVDLPAFNTLAHFRTEMAKNDSPPGVMINSPAIFAAPYQSGRVLCISPHPEQTEGLEEVVPRAVHWVSSATP